MMISLGHTVYLYAGTANDADCTEHIVIMPKERQRFYFGDAVDQPGYPALDWTEAAPYWKERNDNSIKEIAKRVQEQDFIIFFDGRGKPVMDYFMPIAITVEAGVGYSGVFAKHRVWESYAWMHCVYGELAAKSGGSVMNYYGLNYDHVIPNSYDTSEFEVSDTAIADRKYALYIGRMVEEKGVAIAEKACEIAKVPLLMAGEGPYEPTYGKKVGLVGPIERKKLMKDAKVVLVPSLYLEPFGGVVAESMLSGTPVITSDWGAFSENVITAVNGTRCRTLKEWVNAIKDVDSFTPSVINILARQKFSTNKVRRSYNDYFEQLLTLWGDGWYDLK